MRCLEVITARAAAFAIGFAVVFASPSAQAQSQSRPNQETQNTIVKILRGKTVCTDASKNNAVCGIEHWSVFVHADGSRTMNVASETFRNGEVRHAIIVVNPQGAPLEAFMHNRDKNNAIGSTLVTLKPNGAEAAIKDTSFDAGDEITVSRIDAMVPTSSVSTGPASADGLHFLGYDFDGPAEQSRNVYWMGGSRAGSMAGSFRPTTHTYVGEAKLTLPNAEQIITDHFRMASGTEVWLTKEDRVVVRMDVKFGNISGTRYDLAEFEIIKTGP